MSTMPTTSQCPQCGFDLEPGTVCRVCGYDPGGRGRPRRRGTVGAIVSASVGLLVVLGAFLGVDLWWHRGPRADDGAGTAPAVVAPGPAPTPERIAQSAQVETESPGTTPASVPAPRPALAVADEAAPDLIDHQLPVSGAPYDITARADDPPTTSRAEFVSWMAAHTDQKEKFLLQKWTLVQGIIRSRTITHARVLHAFLRAPREFFCRDTRRAYEDAVLPIGYGQTISGPYMVARMTDWLNPEPGQKVLEIGTGSGYQSAVLSELSNNVYTVEIVDPLARETDAIYRRHEARYPEYRNIHRKIDDGYYGWKEYAPFDRIIVTCGIDHVPPELLRQLAPGGMMVIPVGPPSGQTILRITKHVDPDGTVRLDREDIFQGKRREIFVPFTARGGGTHYEQSGGGEK